MPPHPTPDPGTAIAFLNTDPTCTDVFRRGVATGPAVHDPRTHQDWIPVVCPDRSRILVHEKLVVEEPTDRPPDGTRGSKTPTAVRETVLRWTCHVAMLADSPCPRWDEVGTVLEDLLTYLSPMRYTVRALTELDPSRQLVDVVLRLTEAAWQLQEGELGATRRAIAAAASGLAGYLTAG